MLKPHSNEWYDRLSTLQQGYYYPWRSCLLPDNGEDTFLDLVKAHISPDADVLEIACGHGAMALELAPLCRSIFGYDRVAEFIDLAQKAKRAGGEDNAHFLHADSSAQANGGAPRIPAEDDSFDLLISRRGPLHWIADAKRVARPGAILIQLNPARISAPDWNDELPELFRFETRPYGYRYERIRDWLRTGGLGYHSTWTINRPEFFDDPTELYRKLSWGFTEDEVPAYAEMQPLLERIFARYATADGLAVPHGRFLWMSVVEK